METKSGVAKIFPQFKNLVETDSKAKFKPYTQIMGVNI
jgi:hypothetical protein